jgi:hypothetical protein
MTLGVSGIDWKHYKHPLPEHVFDGYMMYWADVVLNIWTLLLKRTTNYNVLCCMCHYPLLDIATPGIDRSTKKQAGLQDLKYHPERLKLPRKIPNNNGLSSLQSTRRLIQKCSLVVMGNLYINTQMNPVVWSSS